MTQNKTTKGLTALALMAIVTSFSHAAFTSVAKVQKTATVSFTAVGAVAMSATVNKIVDNSIDTNVNFPAVALPAGWTLASDYLAILSTVTASNGGIQIYTDNTNAAASPKFTGTPATIDPSGLVDNTNPLLKLPVAWSIKTSTGPVPVATEPNNFATDTNAPQWIYMADKATEAITGTTTKAFLTGSPAVEVLDGSLGIHAASGGGPQNNGFFPGNFGNTSVFLSSNFGAASTPRTYSTSELILEAFTQ